MIVRPGGLGWGEDLLGLDGGGGGLGKVINLVEQLIWPHLDDARVLSSAGDGTFDGVLLAQTPKWRPRRGIREVDPSLDTLT